MFPKFHDLEGLRLHKAQTRPMGQDYSVSFQQHQPGVVAEQTFEHLVDAASSSIPVADFGGFEPFVDEVVIARFRQITPRRVLEMARDGEIPAHPIGRGPRKTWRFRISEIDAHFSTKENTTGATLKLAVPGATRRKQ